MISLHVVSVFAMLGIFFMPVPAAAQGAVGTLVGNVRDETGGAVPGATISSALTSRGSCRASSSVSSSPDRGCITT